MFSVTSTFKSMTLRIESVRSPATVQIRSVVQDTRFLWQSVTWSLNQWPSQCHFYLVMSIWYQIH